MAIAGGNIFDPRSLSPALWLSDTGSDPAVWEDLSGNGRNATQATAANRPAIVENALNGRQVRRFDGVNDFVGNSSVDLIRNVQGYTIFHVYSYRSIPATNIAAFAIRWSGGATAFIDSKVTASNAWRTGYRRLVENTFAFFDQGTAMTGFSIKTHVINHNGGTGSIFINGSSQGTASIQTGNTSNITNEFYIGSNAGGTGDFTPLDSAEIIVLPYAATTAQRQAVERYLAKKWGIGFNPLSLSPALWLSDTGSNPAQWDDISGNNRHATQATVASQPAIIQNGLGGRQVRRFDGVDDRLNVNSLASVFAVNDPPISIFIVSRQTQSGGINRQMLMMSSSDFNTFMLLRGGGGVFRYGQRDQSLNIKFVTSTKAGDTEWNVHSVTGSGVNASIFTNGANSQTGDIDVGTMNNLSLAGIGINPVNLADAWVGDIAEILVFPTALSDSDRREVERYLAQKWNIIT